MQSVTLDPMRIPPEVEVKAPLPNNRGRPSLTGAGKLERVDLNPYRATACNGSCSRGGVRWPAARRWVAAVNADGSHGAWAYALVKRVADVGAVLTRALE